MKAFRLMRQEWRAALLVLVLLVGQAACEMALPGYMSDLVDKGIQQSGVSSPVAERLSQQSFQDLQLLMTPPQRLQLADAYQQEGDQYSLKPLNQQDMLALEELLKMPMVALYFVEQQAGEAGLSMLRLAVAAPDAQEKLQQTMADKVKVPESMLGQAAVQFVLAEYRGLGMDVHALQRNYLWRTGGLMLLVTLLMGLLAVTVGYITSRSSARIGRDLRSRVYHKVISFSKAEIDRFSTASLITRTGNDIRQVEQSAAMTLRILLYAPLTGSIGIWRVARLQSGLSWIVVLAVLAAAALVGTLAGRAVSRFRIVQEKVDRQNLVTREILTGLPVIRAFTRERHEEARFAQTNKDLNAVIRYIARTFTLMMPLMMLLMNGVMLMIIWFGAKRIDAGVMQVGAMMAMVSYTMYIVMSFMMLSMTAIMLPRANVSAQRIMEVLDTQSSVLEPAQPAALNNPRGEIVFDHVSFRYPDAEEDVLHDLHFSASPGQTTAIIGGTGSGKSTLVGLIPRLFDVSQGVIRIDGVDIRQMSLSALRGMIGFVPQQGVLFSGTIESNIKYADEAMEEEQMLAAARVAQAEAFILGKEEGYQSTVARGGSNVSGGQKQRLSIARALAKKPSILLFDDSFSALDYRTDLALRQALKREQGNATVLIVAQRIATVLQADKIIVLEQGRIAGQGSHQQLMESCAAYQAIARSQLSDEELGGGAQ